MTYRVVIEYDNDFDAWDPDCAPEIIDEIAAGQLFPYGVILKTFTRCGHCGTSRWDDMDSIWGVLLEWPDWEGVYSLEQLDLRSPGPDANHINELINQMLGGN